MRSNRIAVLWLAAAVVCFCAGLAAILRSAPLPVAPAVDATPVISLIEPAEARPGSQVTVKVTGEHFLPGAYVSFSDPAVRVVATRRVSETQLEVDIAVGSMARPESVSLYVANPSGASARAAFKIVSGVANRRPEIRTPSPDSPKVTRVDPTRVEPGSQKTVKVTGRDFKQGAKVAFSNPGIRVLETDFKKSTQLVAKIEVAANAPTGITSLFVINPDESEVETGFEVGGGKSEKAGSATASASAPLHQFSVYNLGDATSIFQNPGKAKGQLVVQGGKLKYEQDGKLVFTAKSSDIQEIAPNIFFGLNTGTFHIILNSGKTYNFVSTSLAPADTASMIESLRSALK